MSYRFGYDDDITTCDEFAGVGGNTTGAAYVKYVRPVSAANHDPDAIKAHRINHPNVIHYQEDVTKLAPEKMPPSVLYLSSPVCPPFAGANGMRVDFDLVNSAQTMFGEDMDRAEDPGKAKRRAAYRRSRLLMWEPLRYLRAKAAAGTPVRIGVVENVWQARKWAEFTRWRHEFHQLGYHTELIAFNSMHARPVRAPKVPQSRNRLFLAYWHASIGRTPDFRKWLDPYAWCPRCDTTVHAVKSWKQPTAPIFGEMGCYGQQYVYRCPSISCRGQEGVPATMPALAAIDPTLPGIRIGDRAAHRRKPLEPATRGRILAGARRHWFPLLVPTGGTRRAKGDDGARPLSLPMPTRTTSECDAVAMLPFITPLRGGGDKERARSVLDPLSTVTASGNHHGVAYPPQLLMRNFTARGDQGQMSTPTTEPMRSLTANGQQTLLTWANSLLVPYHGTADTAQPAAEPMGTLTTRDRYGIAQIDDLTGYDADFDRWEQEFDLDDVLFRMLEPHEIRTAMGFENTYRTGAKSKRTKVRLYGNAVTPAVMECIVSALVECLTGEELEAASC